MRQKYANVPGVRNCWEKTPPGARLPESQIPVSLLAVWVAAPPFSQRTTSPTCMLSVDGLKLKSRMLTVYCAASAVSPVADRSSVTPSAARRTLGDRIDSHLLPYI